MTIAVRAGREVPAAGPITVMVVDDSAVIRGLLTRMLEDEADIRVIASASNGRMAIDRIRDQRVDVIVLDIEMPIMDGLTAIPQLLAAAPAARIIVASTLSRPGAEVTFRALRAGAADYIPKPTANRELISGAGGGIGFRDQLIAKVRELGRAVQPQAVSGAPAVVARSPASTAAAPAPDAGLREPGRQRPAVVAIGASTGGPQALMDLFSRLDASVHVPILVAQHMPPKFTAILAEHIGRCCGRPCREGEDGEAIHENTVYVAPGDFHMLVDGAAAAPVLRLNKEAPENFCRPAVDPLFRSVARVWGDRALVLVLTGMGSDGLRGGEAIVRAGGTLAAQDEASSVVWGMPGAVVRAGLCSRVAPVAALADLVNTLAGKQR